MSKHLGSGGGQHAVLVSHRFLFLFGIILLMAMVVPLLDTKESSSLGLGVSVRYTRKRLIHDVTLPWDETMLRPWLELEVNDTIVHDDDKESLPSVMILLTTYGWNQPNQTLGRTFARTIRERELYSGLVNHPLFHPTGWEDIENNVLEIRNNTNYYVFLDRMSCSECNYPIYGGGHRVNRDYEFGRAPDNATMEWNGYYQYKPPGNLNLEKSRLFQAANSTASNHLNITAKLVIFDCAGWGDCHGRKAPDIPVSIAFISGMLPQIDEDIDQGLIPPPGKRTILTTKEEESIRSCQAETERDFNVVYWKPAGQDGKELSFTDVLRRTKFALTPRGDNKFSYRFSEVLSAGAIPVYHGDNYVLPFRPELFDWNKCAILLPEKDAGEVAMDYIENKLLQDPETMCSMRKYCYFEIYKKYIETGEKIEDYRWPCQGS